MKMTVTGDIDFRAPTPECQRCGAQVDEKDLFFDQCDQSWQCRHCVAMDALFKGVNVGGHHVEVIKLIRLSGQTERAIKIISPDTL